LAVGYKRLSLNSGLKVSPISLGTWHMPRLPEKDSVGAHKIDVEEFRRVLRYAYDEGVIFIDTANKYHGGISPVPLSHAGYAERLLGRLIRELGLDREELVIATKVYARMSPGPNGMGLSRKHIMWQIRESLSRLQMDYVDIYYAHAFDKDTPKEETLSAFNDLVHQGLVHYLGMSNVPGVHLMEYMKIAEERRYEPIVVLQYRYSLLEKDIEKDVIPVAQRFGAGIAAYSPLAQGVLTGKYIDPKEKKWIVPPLSRATYMEWITKRYFTKENLEILLEFMEIARSKDVTPAQLALAWVMNMEKIWGIPIIPIISVSKLQHLEEAVEAVDIKLSEDELKHLHEISSKATFGYPW